MPDCEEDEGAELTDVPVVHELESLVHVVHHPAVGVDVESFNVVTKLLGRLQSPQLDISTARPVRHLLTLLPCLDSNI